MEAFGNVSSWGMLPTPFCADLTDVDEVSLNRLVAHQKRQGVHGFMVLGIIGEPSALSLAEKTRVITSVAQASEGSPVVAAAMSLDRVSERDLQAFAVIRQLISAVMIPVTSCDPHELRDAVEHAAGVSGRPVVLQDYPAATGVQIAITDLIEVVRRERRIVAVKSEAAPTFSRIRALRDARPDLYLIAGCGGVGLVEDMLAGAQAVACQSTPAQTLCQVADLMRQGCVDAARELLGSIAALVTFEVQQHSSIAIRKEHWRRAGVIAHAGVRGDRMRYSQLMSDLSDSFGYHDPMVFTSAESSVESL